MKTEFLLLGAAGIAESRLKTKREGVTARVATLEFRLLGHQKGWDWWVIPRDPAATQDTTSRAKSV